MAKTTMMVSADCPTYALFNDDGDQLSMVRPGMKWLALREQEILDERTVLDLEN
jgi:hypothetical protein